MKLADLSPAQAIAALKREWLLYHLGDQRLRFMWEEPPPDEWVALDCETTGLDVGKDEIIAIGAVRIVGNRIMTSERLELLVRPEKRKLSADSVRVHRLREQDVAQGLKPEDPLPFDPARVDAGAAVVDIIMSKQPTPLLRECRARGLKAEAGFEMLVQQIPEYLRFFGFDEIARTLQADLSEVRSLLTPK